MGLALVAGVVSLFLVVSTRFLASFGQRASGDRLARMKKSPRWSGSGFVNPEPTTMMRPGSIMENARRQFLGGEKRAPLTFALVQLHHCWLRSHDRFSIVMLHSSLIAVMLPLFFRNTPEVVRLCSKLSALPKVS